MVAAASSFRIDSDVENSSIIFVKTFDKDTATSPKTPQTAMPTPTQLTKLRTAPTAAAFRSTTHSGYPFQPSKEETHTKE